jgi:2-polyprenyl-3-methyl-5-hydroxy-6-metoxy-1,4-benzoquinol methylase
MGADNDLYLHPAGETPIRILDAGCGKGMLTVEYAKAGHDVVGIDPAPKMLDAVFSRRKAERVEWRLPALQTFRNSEPFDSIVMT